MHSMLHTHTANTLCIGRHVPEGAPKQTNGYLQLKGKQWIIYAIKRS